MRINRKIILAGISLAFALGGCFSNKSSSLEEKARFLESFVRKNGVEVDAKNSHVIRLKSGLNGEYNGEKGTYVLSVMDNDNEAGWPYKEKINPILRISLENGETPPIINIADHKVDGEVDISQRRDGKEYFNWNRKVHGESPGSQRQYSKIVDALYGKLKGSR